MTKKRIQYFTHMGTCKTMVTGYKINEELAYTTVGKEKFITHMPTGMRVAYGKESLKKLVEKVNHLMEVNKDMLAERLENNDLDKLPVVESFYTKLDEFLFLFGFAAPLEDLSFDTGDYICLDIVKLDQEVSKHTDHDSNLSLNDNVSNIYGSRALELMEYFTKVDFLEAYTR